MKTSKSLQRSVSSLLLSLSLTSSAHAFTATMEAPRADNRKSVDKLSKLLGGIPVMMATPDENEKEEDECALAQLRSLTRTLHGMSPEARGRVVDGLRVAGIRSLEIKATSPKNDERIVGERIITMGKPKVTRKVDDFSSIYWKKIDQYPSDARAWDLLRYESRSLKQAEFIPWMGWGREGSWLLDNVNNTIRERAKKLQNESQLKGGHLVILPRSHKFVLHRAEYILPASHAGKSLTIDEFQKLVDSGAARHSDSYWSTEETPAFHACFSSIGVGDLLSASEGTTQTNSKE